MISVKNKEPLIYYGSKTIKEVYKGSTRIYPSIDTLKIMDSLVCWYDIGKQQCTNESMATNPVLTDLSGNGHDIECFNFGWSGMSGIGGYTNFNAESNRANIEILGTQHWLINSINQDNNTNRECIICAKESFSTFFFGKTIQVKLTGNVLGETFFRFSNTKIYLKEGVNEITIPAIDSEDFINGSFLTFFFQFETVNVELEILPFYPNALVSDGVDDYCYTTGLPILTDYTVIAKREYTDPSILYTRGNCFASKSTTNAGNEGAFVIELIDAHEPNSEFRNYNFGSQNIIKQTFDSNNPYVYQTTNSYNGEKISKGTAQDTEDLFIFSLRSIETGRLGSIALYSFLLFDRTLTTAEIEWVKQNMIEWGGVLKTDWSDSSLWLFYNRNNEGRIDGTISSNKMVITSNGIRPGTGATANFMEVIIENSMVPAYKIKVTGLKNGIVLTYKDRDTNILISEDGIYSIPEHNTQDKYFGYRFNKAFENENIVIQQLLS